MYSPAGHHVARDLQGVDSEAARALQRPLELGLAAHWSSRPERKPDRLQGQPLWERSCCINPEAFPRNDRAAHYVQGDLDSLARLSRHLLNLPNRDCQVPWAAPADTD